MHLYTNPAQGYLSDAVMSKAHGFFAQAEERVRDSPALLERVQVAKMPLTYAQMFPRNGYQIKEDRLTFQVDSPLTQAMAFASLMEKHGFTNIRESYDSGPGEILRIGALLAANPGVLTLANGRLSIDIVPLLAGRVLRITDKSSGECITAHNVTSALFFPFCGGMESRVGELFRWSGWIEPAKVVEHTPESITIALETADGFQLKRKVAMTSGEPILQVETILTNPGNESRWARLRNHLELDMGDLPSIRLRFENLAGDSIDQDMTGVLTELRDGQHFRAEDIPNGAWEFTGSKGLTLTQRFDANQLDHTWIYGYPEDLGELEVELWGKRVRLEPRESVSLIQEVEVRKADGL